MIVFHINQKQYDLAKQMADQVISLSRFTNSLFHLAGNLHGKADLIFRQGKLLEAKQLNDEALELARQTNRKDTHFNSQVLAVRLQAAMEETDISIAAASLKSLLAEWPDPPEQAVLQYEIWRLDPTNDNARQTAADLYQTLYTQTPNTEYRQRYRELTGELLPEPPPLPPLPDTVTAVPADLPPLLEQVDQLIAQNQIA